MSIVAFAAWLFVFIVFAPLVLWLVRIFLPYILGTIIAAAHLVPIALILLLIGWVIAGGLQQPPARQRYQPVQSDDTLNRLYYNDPIFRHNVGLPATSVATPQTEPVETLALRAELVNPQPLQVQPGLKYDSDEWLKQQMAKWRPIEVTGQPSAGPIPVTGQP